MSEYTESIEGPEVEDLLTEQDKADLEALNREEPPYHPILQIWRELLSHAPNEQQAAVTPQWANKITSSYREVMFSDMPEFRDRVFGKIMEFASVLETVIESDPDCLTYTSPEEDVEHNSKHYRDLLAHWQILLLGWELAWDCEDPYAGVELGAISEVHRMVFSQGGITQYLDNIRFEYTEADQLELQATLEELKDKAKEGK